MKNNQISPSQIPHLVRLTADLFREMREETKAPNMNPMLQRDEHNHMHYVADLLKDLVETAYPKEENNTPYIGVDMATGKDFSVITMLDLDTKEFDEGLKKIIEVMKSYKPAKAGEF